MSSSPKSKLTLLSLCCLNKIQPEGIQSKTERTPLTDWRWHNLCWIVIICSGEWSGSPDWCMNIVIHIDNPLFLYLVIEDFPAELQHQTDWITTLCFEFHLKDIQISHTVLHLSKNYIDIKSRRWSPDTSNKWFLKTHHPYIFQIFKEYYWEAKSSLVIASS